MPGTELRSAVSMTVAPTCASTVRDCPDASMKVIFAIEQSDSLEYRFTPRKRVNSVGERRLYRGRLHRASTTMPKEHSECLARGRRDSWTAIENAAMSPSTVARLAPNAVDFREGLV